MSAITKDAYGYEGMNGLGDAATDAYLQGGGVDTYTGVPIDNSASNFTSLASWINTSAPIPATNASGFASSSPSMWDTLLAGVIGAGAKTGLQIAANVTNPAYNTPGSYTRLPDGTVIATAGTAVTNYGAVSPTSFNSLLNTGGGSNLLPLLLIGGAILLFATMGKH